MRKHGFLGVAAAIVLMACLLMGSASAAFAADQMTLSISPDKTAASVGDTVTYTYIVTNNSTDNITNLTLSDNKLGSITVSPATLLPGENVTATKSYIVTISDLPGPFGNTATAAGTLSAGDNITTAASASVSINPLNSALQVVKSANKTSAEVGDNITYTYAITNSGTTALTGLVLTDSKFGAISLSTIGLTAGENTTATRIYTVVAADLPGPLTNTATVTATNPSGATVTATSNRVVIKLSEDRDDRDGRNKGEILKDRGVPGKGIDKAPGLQKFFNPRSNAFDRDGKKDKDDKGSKGRGNNNGRGNGNNNGHGDGENDD